MADHMLWIKDLLHSTMCNSPKIDTDREYRERYYFDHACQVNTALDAFPSPKALHIGKVRCSQLGIGGLIFQYDRDGHTKKVIM